MPIINKSGKEKVPPQNLDAEKSILASMMLNEECVYTAQEMLKASDFYNPLHQEIFNAMEELTSGGIAVDYVTLSARLEQTGKVREGTLEYLANLTLDLPSYANLEHYINIVYEKSELRKLINASIKISDDCYFSEDDADTILGRAGDEIYKIAVNDSKSTVIHIKKALQESYIKISEAMQAKEGIMGLPTGFPLMDKQLSGLQGTQLIVIAGRPGMGKTSFAMNIVEHVVMAKNVPALVFSLEMSYDQLATRLLCAHARVDSQNIRQGKLTAKDFTQLAESVKMLSSAPLYIDDSATINVTQMLAKAHRLKKQHGLGLIAIDYLQLMQGSSRHENRVQEIAQITRALKIMAKELDIPILLLSQLSRASESKDNKYPKLSHLRESGTIEQDADVVIFLQREDYYNAEENEVENKGKARIIIAKQRNGPTGSIQVQWHGEYTKYVELAFIRDDEVEA